jgi:hypothetical protein
LIFNRLAPEISENELFRKNLEKACWLRQIEKEKEPIQISEPALLNL